MKKTISKISESTRERSLAIFCGAGISWNSGLPLANELKQSILEKLPMDVADRDEVTKSNLPFEALMETLTENTDISKLLDIFEQGTPNASHILIAHLAKAGYLKTIATTNFDLLIERAMEKEGLIRDKGFRVYYDEKQFSEIDFDNIDDGIIRLFKIHGTVGNKKERESIRTTMRAVAGRTLSEKRMNLIRYLFSTGGHTKVLILGYSCSDEFDITPQIQSLEENLKEIIFIEHSTKEEEKAEDVKTKGDKNPFKRFIGTRVIYNTDEVIKKLWTSLRPEEYEFVQYQPEWTKFVDEWATGLEKDKGCRKYLLAGFISFRISNFRRMVEYSQQALEIAKAIGDKALEGTCYEILGCAYSGLKKGVQDIEYYQQALEVAKSVGNKTFEVKCYLNLGTAYFGLWDFQRDIEYQKQALEINKSIGDKTLEAKCYLNLGGAYTSLGDFERAIEYHQQALESAKVIGDKALEAGCYQNLGATCFSLRDFNRDIEYQKQALEINKAIGDRSPEAGCYWGLGLAYHKLGDFKKAVECLSKAKEIFKETGQIHLLRAIEVHRILVLVYEKVWKILGMLKLTKRELRN